MMEVAHFAFFMQNVRSDRQPGGGVTKKPESPIN